MKKIILTLFVGGLILTSCKKDLTCDCTITHSTTVSSGGSSSTNTTSTTSKEEYKEVNKRAFMSEYPDYCKSYTDTDVSTGTNAFGEPETTTYVDTYDCKLAK